MTTTKNLKWHSLIAALLAIILVVLVVQAVQINALQSGLATMKLSSGTTGEQNFQTVDIPQEGDTNEYGIPFKEESIDVLIGYLESIELSPEEEARYVEIGSSPDTSCEYCCGIGERGMLTSDGKIACGCAHNLAQAGLVEYLVKEGYSDEYILDEIQEWKAYFFPQGYTQEALTEQGSAVTVPALEAQRGGC